MATVPRNLSFAKYLCKNKLLTHLSYSEGVQARKLAKKRRKETQQSFLYVDSGLNNLPRRCEADKVCLGIKASELRPGLSDTEKKI